MNLNINIIKSNKTILIKDYTPFQIVIENNAVLYDVLNELSNGFGFGNDISLFQDDIALTTNEIEFVFDIFSLDINNKKNINALNKMLSKALMQTDINLKLNEINALINNTFREYFFNFSLPLKFSNEFDIGDYLKLINIQIIDDNDNLLTKIINFVKASHILRKINIFIFVNIGCFFSKSDLELLKKESYYNKFNIIFIDQAISNTSNNFEKRFILDKDMFLLA